MARPTAVAATHIRSFTLRSDLDSMRNSFLVLFSLEAICVCVSLLGKFETKIAEIASVKLRTCEIDTHSVFTNTAISTFPEMLVVSFQLHADRLPFRASPLVLGKLVSMVTHELGDM